jgi:hypothetical protein
MDELCHRGDKIMNLAVETNEDGTVNLTDNDGNLIVQNGTLEECESVIDEMIEELEDFKQGLFD